MGVSPEQQLRAYVEYFRDVGVVELYQRESPQVGMPERWRELLARPRPPAEAPGARSAGNTAVSSQPPQARPTAGVAKPQMQPARPAVQPQQASIPRTQ